MMSESFIRQIRYRVNLETALARYLGRELCKWPYCKYSRHL